MAKKKLVSPEQWFMNSSKEFLDFYGKTLNQNPYLEIATKIANLVKEKQIAYGDSFGKSGEVIKILFPAGIPVEKYNDMLTIVRILDKIFRICNKKDAFGENPYKDILGYCLLAINENNKR
ncbi:MAG: hypothetical protein QG594_2158 [Bacteroidota bacterium]|nr:hypothetical protein [Bacteroidota bacterium]